MTQEILISDVLIIMMFTPSRDSTSNIFAATPECDRIPTPMSDTLAMDSVTATDRAPISSDRALDEIDGTAQIRLRNGERNVGHGSLTDVLDDHIDHDVGIGHGAEHARGDTRAIRHTDNRNLGLIAVSRHTRHHDPFHIGIFTCHERSLSFFET